MEFKKSSRFFSASESNRKSPEFRMDEVNTSVWHACSGMVDWKQLLSSTVYYFPQGHVESYCNSQGVNTLCSQLPATKCKVQSIKFLADEATDEVFAHVCLEPMLLVTDVTTKPVETSTSKGHIVSAFVKHLKSSDITSLEFSIASQTVGVKEVFEDINMDVPICDIHKKVWKFQYKYDDATSSHTLTEGWCEFLVAKRLSAGDELVFMRTIENEIIIGIRRVLAGDSAGFHYKIRDRDVAAGGVRFKRTGKGLCSVEALSEALGKAQRKYPFQVAYYPRVGGSPMIHDATVVDKSLRVPWAPGMRVKKTCYVEQGLTRVPKFGTITSVNLSPTKSCWKQIQVSWEGEEMESCTNPWEINVAAPQRKRGLEEDGQELTLLGKRFRV